MYKEYENCTSEETETEKYALRRPFDAIRARLANGETENEEDKAFCEFYLLIRKLANRFRHAAQKTLRTNLKAAALKPLSSFTEKKAERHSTRKTRAEKPEKPEKKSCKKVLTLKQKCYSITLSGGIYSAGCLRSQTKRQVRQCGIQQGNHKAFGS